MVEELLFFSWTRQVPHDPVCDVLDKVCVVPSRPCALMRMPVAGLQGAWSSAASSQVRRWFSRQLSRIGSTCVPGLPGCQCGSETAHSDESRCALCGRALHTGGGLGLFFTCAPGTPNLVQALLMSGHTHTLKTRQNLVFCSRLTHFREELATVW